MELIKILAGLDLLSWQALDIGWKNGWSVREDIIDYAVKYLLENKGCDDKNIILIAAGDSYEDGELSELVATKIKDENPDAALDKWRLAHLIDLKESNLNDQQKIDQLQEIYANFNYPDDMTSCGIYACDNIDPLIAMDEVIQLLKHKLEV